MKKYYLELYSNITESWKQIAELKLSSPQQGHLGESTTEYDIDYALDHLKKTGEYLLGVGFPAQMGPIRKPHWPGFAVDLLPAGAAREYWVNNLNLSNGLESDIELLGHSANHPVGNLRIKKNTRESKAIQSKRPRAYELNKIIERDRGFLEYLAELGEPISTFTGAGGASPKILMRQSKDGLYYSDGALSDSETSRLVMIKFSMSDHSSDRNIIRAEGALAEFMNALEIDEAPRIERHGELLIIERFDRRINDQGKILHYGLESFYSALDMPGHGRRMNLFDVVRMLKVKSSNPVKSIKDFVARDFINILLSNSDVHGRNSSLIKRGESVELSPLYDIAPMMLHDDFITRQSLSVWEGHEIGGVPNYPQISKTIEALTKFKGIADEIDAHLSLYRNKFEGQHLLLKSYMDQAEIKPGYVERIIDNYRRTLKKQ